MTFQSSFKAHYFLSLIFSILISFTSCEKDESSSDEIEIIDENDSEIPDNGDGGDGDQGGGIDPNLFSRTDSGFRLHQHIYTDYQSNGDVIQSFTKEFEYNSENKIVQSRYIFANHTSIDKYYSYINSSDGSIVINVVPDSPHIDSEKYRVDMDGKIRQFSVEYGNSYRTTNCEYKDGILERKIYPQNDIGIKRNAIFKIQDGKVYEEVTENCNFTNNCEVIGTRWKWRYGNQTAYIPSFWLYRQSSFSNAYDTNLSEVLLTPLQTEEDVYLYENTLEYTNRFEYVIDSQNRVVKRFTRNDGGSYTEEIFIWL